MPCGDCPGHFFMARHEKPVRAVYYICTFMMKKLLSAVLLFATLFSFGQANSLFKGYFSFNSIKDLSQTDTALYAAAENALFTDNLATSTITTTTTIDGLSGQTITAVYHSPTLNRTIIGYANGLIIVVNADGSIVKVVDIINKQLPAQIKRVNHFMEYGGIVYVSCDFGIVQYNLQTLLFGDTYFIGDNGAEIIVSQTAVFNGNIYAATNSGIRVASATNPNLIDYAQWTVATSGIWSGIAAFGNELIAVTDTGQLNRLNGGAFTPFSQMASAPADLRAAGNYLLATSANRVYAYNASLGLVAQIDAAIIPQTGVAFTCATAIGDTLFIGTQENGVIKMPVSNPSAFENIIPAGPERNNIFSLNKETENLWAVYGDYTSDYNPFPLSHYGISKYNSQGWLNLPYEDVHPPGKDATDLVRVTVDPSNINTIYVSSYHSGLLKFENDELVELYDQSNSGLESLVDPGNPTYVSVQVEQSAFDRHGNLWMSNGLVKNALKVLKADGTWGSVNMESILSSYFGARFGRMVIDKNGTKWMCTSSDGVVAYNENGTQQFKKITFGPDTGNLPIEDVRSIAIDKNNQLWIGTKKGLRVLSSVDRFNSDGQMKANAIIILEEGVAQELLYEQFVTDICVDGSNNKWVGTADSGVFELSPDGQQTIHHFTADNSPLPSNVVNDIEIDGKTGEVFIATDKGMISYKGVSTEAAGDLNNVIVYPNPVRPGYAGTVKITGLLDKAHVKIADITGNLVFETITEGGTIEWDTTAFGKYKVASGVYMIFISAEDGSETKVKKVMIVR
jgi:hypothetical protein